MKFKNKILKLFSVFAILAIVSCTEEDPIESTITNFPTFDYEQLVIVAVGDSFTPGATALEGENEIDVVISGAVNADQVGVYNINYSATNSDGYDGSASQTVIVHDPSIVGTDVSGDIYDTNTPTRTGNISLVSGTTSIFYATDMGGSGILPLYFQMDGDEMYVVSQPYNYSTVNDAVGTYDPIARTFDVTFSTGWNYIFAYN